MNLGIFFELTPDGDTTWWEMLASGLGWTLTGAFFAWIMAFLLGSLVGVIRTTERTALVRLGNAYVELFRNIPLIVQFFIWYFVLPNIIPAVKVWVTTLDPTRHQLVTAIVCLGFFTSARVAEQVRSGIQSLPRGQRMAGYALGLSQTQTYAPAIALAAKHDFEAFAAATLVYVIIALTANRVMAWIERRVAVPGYIAGGR